ncbi:MAG: metallophosphoesterase family protein [bacterium]
MIKIGHSADLHIGASFSPNGEYFRKILLKDFERLCETCFNENIDILLISGDLFDSNFVSKIALLTVINGFEILSKNGIRTLILPGTHDKLTKDSIYYQFPDISNLFIIGLNFNEHYDEKTGVYITGNAYIGDDVGKRALKGLTPKKDALLNIALIHASLERPDIKKDDMMISQDEIINSGFDYIALGHWHRYQVIRSTKPVAIYPGSIEPLSKDEQETGSIVILEYDETNKELSYKRIEIGTLKTMIKEVELLSNDKTAELAKEIKPLLNKNIILTIRLKGMIKPDEEIDIEGIEEQFSNDFFAINIESEGVDVMVDELPPDVPKDSILGRFVSKVQERIKNSKSDEEKRRWKDVLIYGIALSRGKK